jgi:hypothetical protein
MVRPFEGYLAPPFALDSRGGKRNRGEGRSDGKSASGGSREGREAGTARTAPHHAPSSGLPIPKSNRSLKAALQVVKGDRF